MKVLVAYATRHGATAGIATRIAETLTASGHDVTDVPVEEVTDIAGYQAVLLGGAAYMTRWLKPAVRFARRHHGGLGEKLIRNLPAASSTLPSGDFRDWDTIENWATQIATSLSTDAAS